MDQISIKDLPVMARIGVPDAERAKQQELILDIALALDLTRAGESDALDATIDYARVARRVKEVSQMKPRKLIESLAEDCARTLLAEFPIARVRLRVKKPRALAEFGAVYAAVEIERNAKDAGE